MRLAGEVATQLVPTPGVRRQFDQCVTRSGVAIDTHRQFERRDAPECRLRFPGFCGLRADAFVFDRGERPIDGACHGWPAAHQRDIGLDDTALRKDRAVLAGGVRIQPERQDPGRALVEAMDRVDTLTELVAQDLQRKPGFMPVDR